MSATKYIYIYSFFQSGKKTLISSWEAFNLDDRKEMIAKGTKFESTKAVL